MRHLLIFLISILCISCTKVECPPGYVSRGEEIVEGKDFECYNIPDSNISDSLILEVCRGNRIDISPEIISEYKNTFPGKLSLLQKMSQDEYILVYSRGMEQVKIFLTEEFSDGIIETEFTYMDRFMSPVRIYSQTLDSGKQILIQFKGWKTDYFYIPEYSLRKLYYI